MISVVVFDADDTLWHGLDGGYISGVSYQEVGRDGFTFTALSRDLIRRSDGQRFELYADARPVFDRLQALGVVISLASYNIAGPAFAALKCFGIEGFFRHPQVAWSNRKDQMIIEILARLRRDGLDVQPHSTLFIDDDHGGLYRGQMQTIGAAFLQKGIDIPDLGSIFHTPGLTFGPPAPLDKVANDT